MTLQEKEKLLPCPFCGGEARLNDWHTNYPCVTCIGCGTSSDVFDADDTPDNAIKAWNTRHDTIKRSEVVQMIEDEIKELLEDYEGKCFMQAGFPLNIIDQHKYKNKHEALSELLTKIKEK